MRYTFDLIDVEHRIDTTTSVDEAFDFLESRVFGKVLLHDNMYPLTFEVTASRRSVLRDLGEALIVYNVGALATIDYNQAVKAFSDSVEKELTVKVYKPSKMSELLFYTLDALEVWRESREKAAAWKPVPLIVQKSDAINPSHYAGLIEVEGVVSLQWLEHLQHHARFRDPEKFKSAVEMQVRKYLDRCGQKDEELQEILKALWYMKFLAAYIKNGNKPICVADIETILAR